MQASRTIYLKKLIAKRHNPHLKIITGIRRCGKSYLLKTLYCQYLQSVGVSPEQIAVIELDDDRFEELRDRKVLREYVEQRCPDPQRQYYIIIDEIQMVPAFEGAIVSLHHHPNYDIYITGSNSQFLSKDISTRFKDRGTEIRIHPLAFREFYETYAGDKHYALRDYLTFGGMPYLLHEPDEREKLRYLTDLIAKTYLTDVVERHRLRKSAELSALFDVLCSTTGSLVNPTGLAGTLRAEHHLKIDRDTVFAYIGYLEDAFLFEAARRYNIKGKQYLGTPQKYYPEDVGLRNARLNFRQVDHGFGVETVVYNELRQRGYLVDVGMLECRERNRDGVQSYQQKEVDFVARLASKEYYLQVMAQIPAGRHGGNEYRNLLQVPGSFRKIAVINAPLRAYTDSNGILNISLEEFLLNPDSLDL